jgi:hypothetical protein
MGRWLTGVVIFQPHDLVRRVFRGNEVAGGSYRAPVALIVSFQAGTIGIKKSGTNELVPDFLMQTDVAYMRVGISLRMVGPRKRG